MPTATMRRPKNTRPTGTDMARWAPLVRTRGRSMLPTLAPGQWLLTRPAWGRVAVGDVVVATTPAGGRIVKRIAGAPGDVVTLEAGRLARNGLSCDGRARIAGAHVQTWNVPPGHYFLVGDNLQASTDSRVWPQAFVAASRISGVVLRRWPWRPLAQHRFVARKACRSSA